MDSESKQSEDINYDSTNCTSKFSIVSNPFSKFECREKNRLFDKDQIIGKGSYGNVYKVSYKKGFLNTNQIFALKHIKVENENKEGFPITALREIKILKRIKHKNVANLIEIVQLKPENRESLTNISDKANSNMKIKEGKSNLINIYLVFEYMEHDLYGLIHSKQIYFNYRQIKNIFFQILEGVNYLHSISLMHRDLKSANILMNNKGQIKITDFGLSRYYNTKLYSPYTTCVVTLWYRAPEILLGSGYYDISSDMWSVGCILAELLLGVVPFRGKDEMDQIAKIYMTMGTATDDNWKGVNKLKNYSRSLGKQMYYDNLFKKEIEDRFEPTVVDLLMKLLCYDSKKRITAEEALKHSFFTANPPMCRNDEMPVFKDEFHELDINERLDGNKVGNITNLLNENMMVGKKYEFWSYNDVTKNSTTDNRNEFNYLSNKRRNNNVLL